jgi:glycine cleavage system H protein
VIRVIATPVKQARRKDLTVTNVPEHLRYTKDHEWVLRKGPTLVQVGITDYAQSQLGDVVFVQLPAVGTEAKAEEGIAEVESTKSVSDIYAPFAAKVVAVNDVLDANPELLNGDPYGQGWMFNLEVGDAAALDAALGKLLDAAGYQEVIAG